MKPRGRKTTGQSLFFHRSVTFSFNERHYLLILQVFLKPNKETVKMTAIESKEEISDTDSGIILHCGENETSNFHIYTYIYSLITCNNML